jgi:hypothetical protein
MLITLLMLSNWPLESQQYTQRKKLHCSHGKNLKCFNNSYKKEVSQIKVPLHAAVSTKAIFEKVSITQWVDRRECLMVMVELLDPLHNNTLQEISI